MQMIRTDLSHSEQLSWSWISFATNFELDAFLAANDDLTVGRGKRIIFESYYIPGVTLTAKERVSKQLEDREDTCSKLDLPQSAPLSLYIDFAYRLVFFL